MGNLELLDLECILLEKEIFDAEINGTTMFGITSGRLWDIIHNKELIKAEFVDDEIVYIKTIDRELILFL